MGNRYLKGIKEIENVKTLENCIVTFDFKRDFLREIGIEDDIIVTGYKEQNKLTISGYTDQNGRFVIKLPSFISVKELNDTHCHFVEFRIHVMISMYQLYKKVYVLKSDKKARKYIMKHCDNMFWIEDLGSKTKEDILGYIRKDIMDAYEKMQEEERMLKQINEVRRRIYFALLGGMIPFLEKTYGISDIYIEKHQEDDSKEIIPYAECEISVPAENKDWHIQWFTTEEVESDLRLMKVRANVVDIVRKKEGD